MLSCEHISLSLFYMYFSVPSTLADSHQQPVSVSLALVFPSFMSHPYAFRCKNDMKALQMSEYLSLFVQNSTIGSKILIISYFLLK